MATRSSPLIRTFLVPAALLCVCGLSCSRSSTVQDEIDTSSGSSNDATAPTGEDASLADPSISEPSPREGGSAGTDDNAQSDRPPQGDAPQEAGGSLHADSSDADSSDAEPDAPDASQPVPSEAAASVPEASTSEHDTGAAGSLVCSGALPLACGDRWNHDTSTHGRTDSWFGYGCSARAESGREAVYTLGAQESCQISVRLRPDDADLDLFVLRECDPFSCIAASPLPIDLQTVEAVVFEAQAGRSNTVSVDGYAGAVGSYELAVDCLCGATASEFADGEWVFEVDRRWNRNTPDPSTPLPEADYESVTDAASYVVQVADSFRTVSVGEPPLLGEALSNSSGQLHYELTTGTVAGGRFVIWAEASGLQAELTLWGSGVPIVSSERGTLHKP